MEQILNSKNRVQMVVLAVAFGAIGFAALSFTNASTGSCSTSNVVGSAVHTIDIDSTGNYDVWARIQTPDSQNSANSNGIKVSLEGVSSSNCFIFTSDSNSTANQWQWLNMSADEGLAHAVDLEAGEYTTVIYGLRNEIKVDRVLLLDSTSSCTPSNDSSNGEPGDNCLDTESVQGDVNDDGTVNILDLSLLLSDWGASGSDSDLNSDGVVNILDLSTLLSNWGQEA